MLFFLDLVLDNHLFNNHTITEGLVSALCIKLIYIYIAHVVLQDFKDGLNRVDWSNMKCTFILHLFKLPQRLG